MLKIPFPRELRSRSRVLRAPCAMLCLFVAIASGLAHAASSPEASASGAHAAPLFDLPFLLERVARDARVPLAPPTGLRFAPANVDVAHGAGEGPSFLPTSLHFRNCCFATSLTTADLRGDGRTDIISGNGLSYDVTVLLSDGAGGYADPVSLPMPSLDRGTVFVAAGDVNGDGKIDLVATGFDDTSVLLFTGNGDGTFGEPATFTTGAGSWPWGIALADLDGNGTLDIVTSNNNSADVSVLAGDGSGGFADAVTFPAGSFPIAVAVADVTGDGHPDIVTANAGSTDVSVLAGDGALHFAAPQTLSIGPDAEPRALAVADIDGDGKTDIATANATTDGSEFPPPELPGSVSILIADGVGGFASAVQLSTGAGEGRADSVAIADVTGDGHADLVASRPNANSAAVLVADGAGGFGDAVLFPVGVGPGPIAVADVTRDGKPDILTGNAVGSSVSVLPGDGEGGIGFDGNFAAGTYPHAVVALDLDDDGHADVATANAFSNDVSVRFGDGAGGFRPEAHFAVGTAPTSIASGDFNEDGHPDLVAADLGSGEVSILLNDGAGGFEAALAFGVGGDFQSPYAVAVGDANNDGHLDVATADTNVSNESISLLLGDGTGELGAAVLLPVGAAGKHTPQGIVLADVTGDGNADIVTANLYSSDLSLLVGDGTGAFAPAVSLPTDLGPVVVAAEDVNGDGHIDLVTANQTAQSASVLLGDGAGGFAASMSYAIFPHQDVLDYMPWPWGMTLADVTGDGFPDIVTANTQNDTVSVLPNDGAGGFGAYFNFDTGAHPGSVAVADIDEDGAPDIVTANRDGNTISVLRNGMSRPDSIFADGFDIIPI
jgi:VCBS repeat protein